MRTRIAETVFVGLFTAGVLTGFGLLTWGVCLKLQGDEHRGPWLSWGGLALEVLSMVALWQVTREEEERSER